MQRRHLLALAAASTATAAFAQGQDFSKVEIKSQALGGGVFMLTGSGGNMGLSIGDDAVFLIDDQFAPLAPKIVAAIAALTPKPVQFLLNTHVHFDHTGGNEPFGKAGALIFAHDNVRRRMTAEQVIAAVGARQAAAPKVALPVVAVAQDLSLHINGQTINAFHAPRAHTDGDLIVHFRASDVIHMGDTYMNGFYPFVDIASGGNIEGVIAAADRVLALATDKTRIIPGHGPLAAKADLQAWRNAIAAVTQRVKDLRKAGKSDSEIRAAKPSAEFDGTYGGGFIKPDVLVQSVLDSLPK